MCSDREREKKKGETRMLIMTMRYARKLKRDNFEHFCRDVTNKLHRGKMNFRCVDFTVGKKSSGDFSFFKISKF